MPLQARTGIPADEQILTYAGRLLHGHRLLSSYGVTSEATIRLSLRLCGGKGGFGSLLRGAGRAIQSGNTDACRVSTDPSSRPAGLQSCPPPSRQDKSALIAHRCSLSPSLLWQLAVSGLKTLCVDLMSCAQP